MQFLKALILAAFFASGAALAATPISTCDEFQTLVGKNLSGSFYLTNDIDCGAKPFLMLGNFTGQLDGRSFTMKNLLVKRQGGALCCWSYGIFFSIGGTNPSTLIKDIQFENVTMYGGSDQIAGGLASRMTGGTIQNVKIDSTIRLITESTTGGGLIGSMSGGSILDSEVKTTFVLDSLGGTIGGAVGMAYGRSTVIRGVTVKKMMVQGFVNYLEGSSGGLVGYLGEGALVEQSQVQSGLVAGSRAGGIVGTIEGATVHQTSVDEKVQVLATLDNKYNAGGGLVGRADCYSNIADSQSAAVVVACRTSKQNSAFGLVTCKDPRPEALPKIEGVVHSGSASENCVSR